MGCSKAGQLKEQKQESKRCYHKAKWRTAIGRKIESIDIQLLAVKIIFLDLMAIFVAMYISCSGSCMMVNMESPFHLSFLRIFSQFTLMLSITELTFIYAAFRADMFHHIGYTMDFFILLMCFLSEISGKWKGLRILGFLRFWRVKRLLDNPESMIVSEVSRFELPD